MAGMTFLWKVFTSLFLTSLLFTTSTCTNCSISDTWNGQWFITEFANERAIVINSNTNSIQRNVDRNDGNGQLGDCVWKEDDFYAFRNPVLNCTKCILINQRHKNVLYSSEASELECLPDDQWDAQENHKSWCVTKLSDSENQYLYWFRKDYKPSNCPIRDGSFQFHYKRGDGQKCETPVSHASSCLESTQLWLYYEGCYNNPSASAQGDLLTCVGDWEETAGYRYFVADVNRKNQSLQEHPIFRCFTYSTNTIPSSMPGKPSLITGYKIGTSNMATCNGLAEPDYAETILTLAKEDPTGVEEKPCSFPSWMAAHKWIDMGKSLELVLHPQEKNRVVHFYPTKYSPDAPKQKIDKRKPSFFSLAHSTLVCLQTQNVSKSNHSDMSQYSLAQVAVVAKYTTSCKIDEICLHLIQRTEYVFQLHYIERSDMDRKTFRVKCFNSATEELLKDTTLISTQGTKARCPYPGKYQALEPTNTGFLSSLLTSKNEDFSVNSEWFIDCEKREKSSLLDELETMNPLSCLDGWSEDNTSLTIVMPNLSINESSKLYCMKSRKTIDSNDGHRDWDIFITSQDCIYSENDTSLSLGTGPYNDSAKLFRTAFCNSSSVGLHNSLSSESNIDSFTSSSTTSSTATKPVNLMMKVIIEVLLLMYFIIM